MYLAVNTTSNQVVENIQEKIKKKIFVSPFSSSNQEKNYLLYFKLRTNKDKSKENKMTNFIFNNYIKIINSIQPNI